MSEGSEGVGVDMNVDMGVDMGVGRGREAVGMQSSNSDIWSLEPRCFTLFFFLFSLCFPSDNHKSYYCLPDGWPNTVDDGSYDLV